MKKLFTILFLTIGIIGCSPYDHLSEPVRMNYAVTVHNQGNYEGKILCRDFQFNGDSTWLFDAGYYANAIMQHHTADIFFVGKRDFMFVKVTKKMPMFTKEIQPQIQFRPKMKVEDYSDTKIIK